mmetsp:Transcript_27400/g.64906  ORF Transcript_27400/g.64906 Transcript_27400/m.64906 type:complete len:89 (-) Transcript_27400:472-738(-)
MSSAAPVSDERQKTFCLMGSATSPEVAAWSDGFASLNGARRETYKGPTGNTILRCPVDAVAGIRCHGTSKSRPSEYCAADHSPRVEGS